MIAVCGLTGTVFYRYSISIEHFFVISVTTVVFQVVVNLLEGAKPSRVRAALSRDGVEVSFFVN
jgi:hypothetical protein